MSTQDDLNIAQMAAHVLGAVMTRADAMPFDPNWIETALTQGTLVPQAVRLAKALLDEATKQDATVPVAPVTKPAP